MPDVVEHRGGCHCGRVRFAIQAPAEIEAVQCNCSICAKSAYLHLIVARESFALLQGAESLTTYTFNTRTARHLFCSVCGVKSFYVPRSHPDGYSVNVNCLDPGTVVRVLVVGFDGAHWEENIAELKVRS